MGCNCKACKKRREYSKRVHFVRKAQGLCHTCGKNPRTKIALCDSCAQKYKDKSKKDYYTNKSLGKCQNCQLSVGSKSKIYCDLHFTHKSELEKARKK